MSDNLDFKTSNIVKTEVFCLCPSLLIDTLYSDAKTSDDFSSAMYKYDEETGETEEALEFWLVSNWLAKQLEKHGGCVYDLGDAMIWGRSTSGQAISQDTIIEDIAKEW